MGTIFHQKRRRKQIVLTSVGTITTLKQLKINKL
jgi:hypothetical protein